MGMEPFDGKMGQTIKTDVIGVNIDQCFPGHLQISAANATAAVADGIIAAFATSGSAKTTKTTGFTQPSVPRNITATAGGTATDIKAVQVTITGTDYQGNIITEDLPAFTVDTAGIVSGAKAFKTITKVEVPAMDGAGVTVSIGFGEILGLPYKMSLKLNSSLNGSVVDAYIIV